MGQYPEPEIIIYGVELLKPIIFSWSFEPDSGLDKEIERRGFCALAIGLQRYIKAMGGGGNYIYNYIYIFTFTHLADAFIQSFFSVSIFLDSVIFPFSFYGLLFNDQIKLYLSKSMSN